MPRIGHSALPLSMMCHAWVSPMSRPSKRMPSYWQQRTSSMDELAPAYWTGSRPHFIGIGSQLWRANTIRQQEPLIDAVLRVPWFMMWEFDSNGNTRAPLPKQRRDALFGSTSVATLPMALGTYCKSLYVVCNKTGSLPDERRAALDLRDFRESLEHFGDAIRWVPTVRVLVDSLTKGIPTVLLTNYLRDMTCSLTYDQYIKVTQRALTRVRTSLR